MGEIDKLAGHKPIFSVTVEFELNWTVPNLDPVQQDFMSCSC